MESSRGQEFSGMKAWDYLCLLLPVSSAIDFTFVGRILLLEILMLVLLPYVLIRSSIRLFNERECRLILVFGLVWLLSQIVSDLINGSDFSDYIRGWAKISLTLVNFIFLILLFEGQLRRFALFTIGLAVTGMIAFKLRGDTLDPWRFSYGPLGSWLAVAGFGFFARKKSMVIPIGVSVAAGLVLISLGARNLAGTWWITGALVFAGLKIKTVKRLDNFTQFSIICGMGLICYAILVSYEVAAESRLLGADVFEKYEKQKQSGSNVLIAGRAEVLVSLIAITDAPFLGHGSWARDPGNKYLGLLFDIQGTDYAKRDVLSSELGVIPMHSHVFESWVQAGVVSILFWGFVLVLIFRTVFLAVSSQSKWRFMLLFFSISFGWDVIFSPFGFDRRVVVPSLICMMISAKYLDALPAGPTLRLASRAKSQLRAFLRISRDGEY